MTNHIKWIREITPLTLQPQCGLIAEYTEAYESRLGKRGETIVKLIQGCQTVKGATGSQG